MKPSGTVFSLLAGGLAGALALGVPRPAQACGCFTPPDPSTPVVQAGERIVFAGDGGNVTATIQIQYSGNAQDFGWLLPLPSVPTLEIGSDELFRQLLALTQPQFNLKTEFDNQCASTFEDTGGAATPGVAADGGVANGPPSPLVVASSVGPYDYAVLKADAKQPMLDWLAANHYFVPAGTDDAVAAYIHPGAYFLALKLKPGASAGDIAPVVVHYASDLPMIPIVLTSTSAARDMGVQVWLAGDGRAIPRNYYHTVLDDAALDWTQPAQSYAQLVVRAATQEAPKHHSFVTQFAGASSIMKGALDDPNKWGSQGEIATLSDPVQLVQYLLRQHGYDLTGTLLNVLSKYVPEPPDLVAQGIQPGQFYFNIQVFLPSWQAQHPDQYAQLYNYDPKAVAQELWDRIVTPSLTAAKMFVDHPYLTELFTVLEPEDMTEDPVFSFNPSLPDVSNVFTATERFVCMGGGIFGGSTSITASVQTGSGFTVNYGNGQAPTQLLASLPASLRIEILADTGAPKVVTDNTATIHGALGDQDSSGCSVGSAASGRAPLAGLGLALLTLAGVLGARRRRRA